MPSPEDLSDSEPEPRPYVSDRSRPDRQERPDPVRAGFEDAVWFRIDLGRNKNAEARWLLPLLCRRGHLTKRDLGAIRVYDRETRFQVAAEAVERFELAAAKGEGDGGRIRRLEDDAPPPQQSGRGGPPMRQRPPRSDTRPVPVEPAGSDRPWTPPIDGETSAPRRPAKAKRPFQKKRRPNG